MKWKILLATTLVVVLLVVLLFVFQKPIGEGDGGLISDKPCGAPCFWGIYPGLSTRSNVADLIQKQGISKLCSDGRAGNFDTTHCRTSKCCQIYGFWYREDSEIVERIIFEVRSGELKVESAIRKFGEPAYVFIFNYKPYSVGLVYGNLGMFLVLDNNIVSPDAVIVAIEYFDPKKFTTETLYEGNLPWQNMRQTWRGYGEYLRSNR